ncbi:hypothetical protein GGR54DRAFT_632228 [Hypoxylon sp. NC1633]|nr:hypothetical protein GGR54DRAFT_632228 [Hypoxylon sp. NC1633]
MSDHSRPRILVVGAGAMGIITGYHLGLAGADVTFLIRPHRSDALNRPQILYCYDDNQLKEYKDYTYITDPSKMIGASYDFIVITVDGASLRNETGLSLMKTIGEAARHTNTKVVLGCIFIDILSVINGHLDIHVYAAKDLKLPPHAPADPDLIKKADFAYTDKMGSGFTVEDTSPAVADEFAKIYNASGVSRCAVKSVSEYAIGINPKFPIFPACELLGWPKFQDIDIEGELWTLVVASVKEIQELSIHGEPGQQAAHMTTRTGFAASLVAWEKNMLPLDLQAFNCYHHGKKLKVQGREHLEVCISYGEAEGKPMPALRELMRRVREREVVAA